MPPVRPMPKKMPKTAGGTNGSYGYHFPVSREPLQFQVFGVFHGFASLFFFPNVLSCRVCVGVFFWIRDFFRGNGKLGRWEDSTFINRNQIFQWKKSRQLSCSESPTRLASQILGKHCPLYHGNLRVPPPMPPPPPRNKALFKGLQYKPGPSSLDRAVWPSCLLSWRDLLGFRWFPHCGNVKCEEELLHLFTWWNFMRTPQILPHFSKTGHTFFTTSSKCQDLPEVGLPKITSFQLKRTPDISCQETKSPRQWRKPQWNQDRKAPYG